MTASVRPLPTPGPVRRLTFEYEGDRVSLVSEQHVHLIVPPTQPLESAETEGGFAVILRDRKGNPLYRLTQTSPMRHDAEVFSESGDRTLERIALEHPKGTFTVLVPDVDGADSVELYGHPLKPQAHLEAPRSLARFKLQPFERR